MNPFYLVNIRISQTIDLVQFELTEKIHQIVFFVILLLQGRAWNEAEVPVPILQGPCLSRVWNEAEVPVSVLQGPGVSLAWNEAEMPLSIVRLSSVFFKFFEAFGCTTIYKKQCFTAL